MKKCIIITTINEPNKCIEAFAKSEYDLIVVGDLKTSESSYRQRNDLTFLGLEEQEEVSSKLSKLIPNNHYCRKNLGYLYAIQNGYKIIAETDDDNIPYKSWGNYEKYSTSKVLVSPERPNTLKEFTSKKIWPRGYDLSLVNKRQRHVYEENDAPVHVWQGLADIEPDVDAIYRLTRNNKVKFKTRKQIVLGEEVYAPFNTQNTIWISPETFYNLYVPCTVAFRYCDILRSYVAQKMIWMHGGRIGHNHATVYQERNAHEFFDDFIDEIPVYLHTPKVIKILKDFHPQKPEDLLGLYNNLYLHDIVQKKELAILKEWLKITL
tara:strand:+ start:35405 stop:36370 length:966 start_codon:yes stop_codon:yes gene_type:complete